MGIHPGQTDTSCGIIFKKCITKAQQWWEGRGVGGGGGMGGGGVGAWGGGKGSTNKLSG